MTDNVKKISQMIGHMSATQYVNFVLQILNLKIIADFEAIDAIGLIGTQSITTTTGSTGNVNQVTYEHKGYVLSGECGD